MLQSRHSRILENINAKKDGHGYETNLSRGILLFSLLLLFFSGREGAFFMTLA